MRNSFDVIIQTVCCCYIRKIVPYCARAGICGRFDVFGSTPLFAVLTANQICWPPNCSTSIAICFVGFAAFAFCLLPRTRLFGPHLPKLFQLCVALRYFALLCFFFAARCSALLCCSGDRDVLLSSSQGLSQLFLFNCGLGEFKDFASNVVVVFVGN